jgi:hypothetical protein
MLERLRRRLAAPRPLAAAADPAPDPFLSFPDPWGGDAGLRGRSRALEGGRDDWLPALDAALAALTEAGRLRPDQRDYAVFHRRRFAETAAGIAHLLGRHPDWPAARVLEVGSSITPMLYHALFPELRLNSLCLFRHPQLTGLVEEQVALDLERLDLRAGTGLPFQGLHMVLLCEVLEHLVVNPSSLFRVLAATLAPGGLLYVTTPNFFRASARAALLSGRNPQPIYPADYAPEQRFHHHVREYAMTELTKAMTGAGLVLEAACYSDCWDDPAASLAEDARANLVVVGRRA